MWSKTACPRVKPQPSERFEDAVRPVATVTEATAGLKANALNLMSRWHHAAKTFPLSKLDVRAILGVSRYVAKRSRRPESDHQICELPSIPSVRSVAAVSIK